MQQEFETRLEPTWKEKSGTSTQKRKMTNGTFTLNLSLVLEKVSSNLQRLGDYSYPRDLHGEMYHWNGAVMQWGTVLVRDSNSNVQERKIASCHFRRPTE